jgi:hypothetical protein
MTHRNFNYSLGNYTDDITLDLRLSDRIKISDEVIDTALMITMNELMKNLELTEEQEEPE